MKKNLVKLFITVFVILFVSCATKPITTASTNPIVTTVGDLSISLQYIPEEQLIDLYGNKENIFIKFPSLVTRKKTVVFQLDIRTETSIINFNLNDIILKIGDVSGESKTKTLFLRAWKTYLKEDSIELKADKMVRETMLDDHMVVSPDQPLSGWIVFLQNYPDGGEAQLSLQLTTASGDSGTVEIPLDFYLDTEEKNRSSDSENQENTGIFAE